MNIYSASYFSRLVYHESVATTLAIIFTLKCKHIDSHYGIVVPVSYISYLWNTFHILVHILTFVMAYSWLCICAKPFCVLFVSCTSSMVFNHSAYKITEHSEGYRPYLKSHLYVEDLDHRKSVLVLSNGLDKPVERAHDRNKSLQWVGFDPPTSWLTEKCFSSRLLQIPSTVISSIHQQ